MEELTQHVVENWINSQGIGFFSTKDAWDEIGIATPENKTKLRVILGRCIEKKLIVRCSANGHYRILDTSAILQDWETADSTKVLPIILPFSIHKYAKLFPKSIVIVAGEKNAGKTAFLYKCIQLNYATFDTVLFNSETGMEQMKERFAPLKFPSPAPFKVYERYDNYADIIDPEGLSIIDYLDFDKEVYLAGAAINEIFKNLTTGCCIIGMQMPPPANVKQANGDIKKVSRDTAYGGEFTRKRSQLYITLGQGICKLVTVKNPAIKGQNPNNKQWSYRFDDNGYFTDIKEYRKEEA